MRALKESGKGTYVLILQLEKAARIRIGKLGVFDFNSGIYAYVGSAFGPGGVGSRVGRHRKVGKTCHWHIDYLRRRCRLTGIWYMVSPIRREHDWALILVKNQSASIPIPGFGSSDCQCPAHLIHFKSTLTLTDLKKHIDNHFPNDQAIESVFG